MKRDPYPQRIVCLTEESTEMLYLLGEEHRIVGISGFTVRPARARKEKPKVSAYTSANIQKIVDLKPDLVIGFSDIQADIAKSLIALGMEVWVTNHRSIQGILDFVVRLGAMVGKADQAIQWTEAMVVKMESMKKGNEGKLRPRVFFEEWNDPLFSCIGWVDELITVAGGQNIFPELAAQSLGKDRIIADPYEVVKRQPDIILASWCGKKVVPQKIMARPGWQELHAVQQGHIYEVDASIILQPGPAALTDGLDILHGLIQKVM
ncbi:MAG: cobalamin-binding protein [Saprospiraceae bacterium]|nr:cobalamin-binding protein [Saprospiraceae bacterium]